MTNPSDEQPEVDLTKPASPTPPPPTQPMYGQTYGQSETPPPPTHTAYGENPYAPTTPPVYGQTPPVQVPPQSPYGQTPTPTPYGYGYGAQTGVQDSSATTSMILGIVGLASIVFCLGFLLILSPFALFIGLASKKRIDASNGQLRGRSEAQAGFVTGLIGSILLVLGVIVAIIFVIFAVVAASNTDYDSPSYPSDTTFNSDF